MHQQQTIDSLLLLPLPLPPHHPHLPHHHLHHPMQITEHHEYHPEVLVKFLVQPEVYNQCNHKDLDSVVMVICLVPYHHKIPPNSLIFLLLVVHHNPNC